MTIIQSAQSGWSSDLLTSRTENPRCKPLKCLKKNDIRKHKNSFVFAWIVAMLLVAGAPLWADTHCPEREAAGQVRVMTWNILHKGWEKEGHASWEKRASGVVRILREHQPDVVGLQEDSKKQAADIAKALGDYSYLDPYVKKGGGLLIRTEAWQVIKSGKIPIPGKRQASWAILEATQNKQRWMFYNAHFIHRSAENSAADRMDAARQIAKHIVQHAPNGAPVVFTGDFNARHEMPAMRYLEGEAGSPVKFSNAFNLIHAEDDPRGTFRGLSKEHHCDRIDHILINEPVTVHHAEILYYDELPSPYPSDHYPALATLSTGSQAVLHDEPKSISMFNGKDLTGWSALPGGKWEVVDGVIVGTSAASEQRHGMLLSDKQFTDFEVKLEYKALSGNSGFYFRAERVKHAVSLAGFQAEIDASGSHAGGLYETLGRTWVIKPPAEAKAFKPGEWNTMTVRAVGQHIVVHLNGIKTAELKDDPGRLKGHFGLQLHGSQKMDVAFRNIQINETPMR